MRIAIIGAGAAGLAAAWDLARAGHEVLVYEAGREVGGLAAGFKDPTWDWTLEKFYHHWFYSDQDILTLLAEMGLREKVIFESPVTSFWDEAGAFALDKPVTPIGLLSRLLNVLSIPGLPLLAKLRFGAVAFAVALIPDGAFLEKYTADAWLTRWVGEKAHARLWRPMLIGKFGGYYDQVNMAWMWARLNKRTARLGTYVGGFQQALEDCAMQVRRLGVRIELGMAVEQITQAGAGFILRADGADRPFDAVLSTVGPGLMARLAPGLPEPYLNQLTALKGMGALCVVLATDQQLMQDGTYWLNLPASSPDKTANPFPFLALVEHTNYMSSEHYGGDHILYLGDYLPADHPIMHLTDEEVLDLYLPALRRVNPGFDRSWIRTHWVWRVPYAQPVPLVNHSQHIPAIRTPWRGLYFASMAQVYPWDRGTNYAVEIGRRSARMLMGDFAG